MKKLIALTLLFILALSITGCNNKSNIPSIDEIKTQYYTDDEIERSLQGVKRDELIDLWGQPDRTIDLENEDIWVLNERKALVISYNIFGTVDDADIED